MASPPKQFDVWFVAANTVYRGVPYNVVADWTQQGRLAPTDMLRPAGTNDAWQRLDQIELLADYLPRGITGLVPDGANGTVAGAQQESDLEHIPRRFKEDDDDDVDMIPLIDISMVLLVFFIMMRAAGALSPVEVPEMKYAGELSKDPNAITISIEKLNENEAYYTVRVGEQPPKPPDDKIPNPEEAMAAVDKILGTVTTPPTVRIACRKDLPSERVYELMRELKIRREKGQIHSFEAEVNEAPKQTPGGPAG